MLSTSGALLYIIHSWCLTLHIVHSWCLNLYCPQLVFYLIFFTAGGLLCFFPQLVPHFIYWTACALLYPAHNWCHTLSCPLLVPYFILPAAGAQFYPTRRWCPTLSCPQMTSYFILPADGALECRVRCPGVVVLAAVQVLTDVRQWLGFRVHAPGAVLQHACTPQAQVEFNYIHSSMSLVTAILVSNHDSCSKSKKIHMVKTMLFFGSLLICCSM